MRGKIVTWDAELGSGELEGEDGVERRFSAADLIEEIRPVVGVEALFIPDEVSGAPLAKQVRISAPPVAAQSTNGLSHVVITDIHVPFGSVLALVFKVAVAGALVSLIGAVVFTILKVIVR